MLILVLVLVLVLLSALVLVCVLGLSRVAADSDRASEAAARGVRLRLLAQRSGDRRSWIDGSLLHEPVNNGRRLPLSDRRPRDRRADPVVVDPRS